MAPQTDTYKKSFVVKSNKIDPMKRWWDQAMMDRGMQYVPAHQGSLGALMGAPLTLLPASMPSTLARLLPMNKEEADRFLEPELSFSETTVQAQGLISKLVNGSSPLAPFYTRGICVVGRVSAWGYSQLGAKIDKTKYPLNVPPVIPVAGLPADATARPAVFSHGFSAWKAFLAFLASRNFQYLLQGRYLMVNERAIDLGVVDSQWLYKGYGLSQISPMPDIRRANAHWTESEASGGLGKNFIFQPTNVDVLGDGQNSPKGLPPQLSDVQWAQPSAPGVFGCCYPVRPHVIFPSMNYVFQFVRNNSSTWNDILEQTIRERAVDQPFDGSDVTVAAGNNPAVWVGNIPFDFGELEIGILLRGGEMIPEECLEWLLMFGAPYMSMLSDNRDVFAQLQSLAIRTGLNGLPMPLLPGDKRLSDNTSAINRLGGLGEAQAVLGAIPATEKRELLKQLAGDQIWGSPNEIPRNPVLGLLGAT